MDTPIFPNYIDGQWTDGGSHFENRNPANTDRNRGPVRQRHGRAISRQPPRPPRRALPAWSNLNAPARGAILFKAAEILERRFDQVAADMTREEGKTLPEAKGEVRRAINIFRYFGGEGSRLEGLLVPSERDRVHMFAIRKPIGVVGLITPWNFPSAIPAWKLAPALICGNTVVLKPASAAPLSAWRIVEALHEAGIPKGVVNFVAGIGRRTGPGAGRCAAAQGHLVHRLLRDRQLAARRSLQAPPAHPTRNGRQESHHRAGRRRFQLRRREHGQCRVLLHRAEMHRHQPRHRGRCHLRSLPGRGGGAHAQTQGRRRHAAGHRHRPLRRPGANGHRAALHRNRPQGSGRAADRRPPAHRRWRSPKAISSSPPSSPM